MLEEDQSTILNEITNVTADETADETLEAMTEQTAETDDAESVADAMNTMPVPRRSGASERALRAAIEIFTRWENDEKNVPLDRIVSGEFRTRKYLNSTERRWVAEAVYGCARFWRRQVFVLEAQGRDASPENVVRLWAEQSEEKLDEDSSQNPKSKIQSLEVLPSLERTREYLRITLSFPDEMAEALESLLEIEAITAAQAFNMQAPTTLRVNPLRVSWAHLRKSLTEAAPTIYSPWGLEMPRRVNVFDVPGYRTGWFEVQEEASQLVSLLVDAQPGQEIAEVGAGAGGKTLALAALMENKGEVFAIDTSKARLEELEKRAERAGVTCVQTCWVAADYEGEWQPTVSVRRTVNKWRNRADSVLVDAPCTGSGVLRRSPDAKWREFDLMHMTRLQSNLLAQAATLVKPGGHLFYVSCAFERVQNEDIVEKFLATELGQQYEIVPAVPRLRAASVRARAQAQTPPFLRTEKAQRKLAEKQTAETAIADAETPQPEADFEAMASGPYLRTWPHRHGLDAFFAACLRRKPV
jgi:16S rRNA (cytosine967-C5)-methyltransferase